MQPTTLFTSMLLLALGASAASLGRSDGSMRARRDRQLPKAAAAPRQEEGEPNFYVGNYRVWADLGCDDNTKNLGVGTGTSFELDECIDFYDQSTIKGVNLTNIIDGCQCKCSISLLQGCIMIAFFFWDNS